ncbi:hypothetical protein CTZ27_09625 [Streptomyces griseocarneus]|nr:hypothetical protein CTZ27_09625 [Streptomyces griseocarneus]
MSAPLSGSADSSPVQGFYPDPSIPGYIRYWSGTAWVPGTSRPAPAEGEPLPAPPVGYPKAPAPTPVAPAQPVQPAQPVEPQRQAAPGGALPEETGPMFLDQEPALREARAWTAGPQDGRRAPWDEAGGPTIPPTRDPRVAGPVPEARTAPVPAEDAAPAARPGGTIQLRTKGSLPAAVPPSAHARADRREAPEEAPSRPQEARPAPRARRAPEARPAPKARTAPAEAPVLPPVPERQALPAPADRERPATGWAQQVHQLAQQQPGAPGAVGSLPWKPPKDDPFLRAAQEQGRPAPLGRRFLARLVDTAVLGAVVSAVAVPLCEKSVDHIDLKVQQAKQSGQTVTVWLLDGTTGPYLAIVLAVLLVGGLLYEALPTAKWGRTLGKKLCGVRVLDIESHDTPSFGAAARRWLLYGVLGVVAVGVLGVLWCLFDRPWRQCLHDKAARTFVAAGGR